MGIQQQREDAISSTAGHMESAPTQAQNATKADEKRVTNQQPLSKIKWGAASEIVTRGVRCMILVI
jgi:hypothetical protein